MKNGDDDHKAEDKADVSVSVADANANANAKADVSSDGALVGTASKTSVAECDADLVLETIDSCVACAEGVQSQHDFEERGSLSRAKVSSAEHGLTDAEAAWIRLQVAEETKKKNVEGEPNEDEHEHDALASIMQMQLPPIDTLNLCGNDEFDDDHAARQVNTNNRNVLSIQKTSPTSSKTTDATASSPTPSLLQVSCAICFDEAGGTTPESPHSTVTFCHLPCCGSDEKQEICTSCILLLTHPTSDRGARVGRCPRCRAWIAVQTDSPTGLVTDVQAVQSEGQCQVCNQHKAVLVENDENVCDACFLGRRRPLIYECEQCHATQKIPHPMYRYQPKVDAFGKTSWACQGLCQNFTMWRILPEQLRLIPPGDTPEEWGDDYLQIARDRIKEAREGFSPRSRNGDSMTNCVIS